MPHDDEIPEVGEAPTGRSGSRALLALEEHNHQHLVRIEWKLDWLIRRFAQMENTQEEIDAAVQALKDDETGLDASVTRIEEWITAHPDIDTSGLVAEVGNIKGHVDAVDALVPAPVDTGGDVGTPTT